MGTSLDGSILVAGTTGSLVTSVGTWTFGSKVGNDYAILLNGSSAGSGYAVNLVVAQSGHMFANTNDGRWYTWDVFVSGWVISMNPYPPVLSPDGSILVAGITGSLVTSSGTWTFSSSQSGGDYGILLNGQSAAGGYSYKLVVAQGGKMFANGHDGRWWVWSGVATGWVVSANPLQ